MSERGLGIIPELERDCIPRHGESVVTAVDHKSQRAYIDSWGERPRWVPWSALRTRDGSALLEHRRPCPGDIVTVLPPRAPARAWRIRVDTGPVGYLWLEWLGACARVAGVAPTPAP